MALVAAGVCIAKIQDSVKMLAPESITFSQNLAFLSGMRAKYTHK